MERSCPSLRLCMGRVCRSSDKPEDDGSEEAGFVPLPANQPAVNGMPSRLFGNSGTGTFIHLS